MNKLKNRRKFYEKTICILSIALMGAEVAPPAGVDPELEVFIYFRKSPKK